MREIFVTELYKEVLGPRRGINEVIYGSPLLEYITGVLAPVSYEKDIIEPDEEIINIESPEINEDEMQDKDVQVPPLLSPALNPQNRPSSFGISFFIKSETPQLDICLTWARYFKKENENNKWGRKPGYKLISYDYNKNKNIWWFNSNGVDVARDKAEISFHILIRNIKSGIYIMNLYFVNRINKRDNGNNDNRIPSVEEHIFQPQIRVVCNKGTRIIPHQDFSSSDVEEQELNFFYRNLPVMGRGFLCSVIWKDIDPQKFQKFNPDFKNCCEEAPFYWIDGDLLPSENDRKKFSLPDIRSEFLPMYHIPAPDFNWRDEYSSPPELNAEKLAESFNPEEIKTNLSPFLTGYKKWIEENKESLIKANPEEYDKSITERLIKRCEEILNRMEAGISLLINDSDVRLAFCFANKALSIQSIWTRKKPLVWRPFQLGYILTVLESIANRNSGYRDICDLLWIPTGGGKTEAYLFLIIFIIALRRRKALLSGKSGAGVSVITRYTLRLLTIQQFRRLLGAITAAEYLRVYGLDKEKNAGWRPDSCKIKENFIWGTESFSAGLWVGGGVTPNRLRYLWNGRNTIPGAIDILKGKKGGEGEPAQITNCPACGSILAIPGTGISGRVPLHLVVKIKSDNININSIIGWMYTGIKILDARIYKHNSPDFYTLSLILDINGTIIDNDIDNFWKELRKKFFNDAILIPVRASRNGYFFRRYKTNRGRPVEYDFEIFCPSPECPLHSDWCEGAPSGGFHNPEQQPHSSTPHGNVSGIPQFPDNNKLIYVQEAFRKNIYFISDRIPIRAYTVDEQIYHRLPSVVVATVDKFARPPFEPRASSLFGVVDHHHCIWGYYRKGLIPSSASSHDNEHPSPVNPRGSKKYKNYTEITMPEPPDLILQDELHLIEGPLGSLVGFYETAISVLCGDDFEKNNWKAKIKYIASTATIRNAEEQIKSIFLRKLAIFPPPISLISDRFFIKSTEKHPLDDSSPGRLYLGICAPGRGPLTPLVRIYSRLLQTAEDIRSSAGNKIDPYWTLTCYFNSIRELGGARALYRQDIIERLMEIAVNSRKISDDNVIELSSRINSTDLPSILNRLSTSFPDACDTLFTTSMFGTGVDVPRLSLMVVNGQPKTTSSYIQATGRVGRQKGALVITFLRASRPRDLSHYEFFCGFHRQIYRYVEPVCVYPFAPGVLEKGIGPLIVFILRNMKNLSIKWFKDDSAHKISTNRNAKEIMYISDLIELRAQHQPDYQKPVSGVVRNEVNSRLDRWKNVADLVGKDLKYCEYAISSTPVSPVVLGDAQHQYKKELEVVFENVPQSLREIEDICVFET